MSLSWFSFWFLSLFWLLASSACAGMPGSAGALSASHRLRARCRWGVRRPLRRCCISAGRSGCGLSQRRCRAPALSASCCSRKILSAPTFVSPHLDFALAVRTMGLPLCYTKNSPGPCRKRAPLFFVKIAACILFDFVILCRHNSNKPHGSGTRASRQNVYFMYSVNIIPHKTHKSK